MQRFFTDTCADHMDKYVPNGDTGLLRQNIRKTADSIKYKQPYAHYQYIGKLYVMDNGKGAYYDPDYGFWSKPGVAKTPTEKSLNYHTPGTGDHWDERMKSAEMQDVIEEVQDYVRKRGNS